MTVALQTKSVTDENAIACCLLTFNVLCVAALAATYIVYQTVFAHNDTAVLVAAIIERRLNLNLKLTEDAVQTCHLPTKSLIGERLHRNLWVLAPVNELQTLTKIVTNEEETGLRLVCTTVV